ncbi:MAG: hypothetical protein GXO71_06990 [Caldiserica bacterium]|nr:hypothetical protein [Caldisericota bacterium]
MKKKRRKFFVYPEVQLNFIFLLVGSGMALSLFFSIFFLYINSQTTATLLSFVQGNELLENYLITTERLLFIGCVLIIILTALLLGSIALLKSHKIAGPLYRLEKTLQEMKEGKIPEGITLRQGDKLTKLAKLLDEVIKLQKDKDKGKSS